MSRITRFEREHFADESHYVALVTEAVQQADAEGSPLAASPSACALVSGLVEARRAQPELLLLQQHIVGDPATPRDLLELIQARR